MNEQEAIYHLKAATYHVNEAAKLTGSDYVDYLFDLEQEQKKLRDLMEDMPIVATPV